MKPDQHYGPLEIWAGEWDQVSHEEWMGVAYTCDLPGKERYIRADRAPVLDEGLVDQLRALVRADDEDILDEPRTMDYVRAMNVARRLLTALEQKP